MSQTQSLPSHAKIPCLDKGFIELQAYCASDLDVVNAARVSFNSSSEVMNEGDEGVLKFLMREGHGSPFEHTFFKFRVKAPIFVFREWHRHRAGHSYNEWSARYSKLAPEFYIPAEGTVVTQIGRPGRYEYEQLNKESTKIYRDWLEDSCNLAYDLYEKSMELGVARQQARAFLPVTMYSVMIWSCNARSLMHFLSLRNSPNAQAEIREYAQAAELIFQDLMPVTAASFIENGRNRI